MDLQCIAPVNHLDTYNSLIQEGTCYYAFSARESHCIHKITVKFTAGHDGSTNFHCLIVFVSEILFIVCLNTRVGKRIEALKMSCILKSKFVQSGMLITEPTQCW